MNSITSRVPAADYHATPAVSITRLKNLKRSPQHYRYFLDAPYQSDALKLGTAAHTATLEPERFVRDHTVWTKRTKADAMSPRKGEEWDGFVAANAGKTILTPDEDRLAKAMAAAVRANADAMVYLSSGEPEVSLQWEIQGRPCKGRADWFTFVDGKPVLVGLKTARDCRHFTFGAQAAKLGYHLQWAFYHDGFINIRHEIPRVVEIVVESAPPHAVAVYRIVDDILDQGREEYLDLLKTLAECERTDSWPGPVLGEQALSLPTWAYTQSDDLADLELETA